MLTPMHRERLQKLQYALGQPMPPDCSLNMHTWHECVNCGTVMCAGGLACTMPEFNKDGLNLRHGHDGDVDRPEYDGLGGYSALEAFFGLSNNQTFHIFSARRYIGDADITACDVIAHIEMVLDGAVE